MLVIVSYDVSTLTKEGRKRLRHVARICQSYGQRVPFLSANWTILSG